MSPLPLSERTRICEFIQALTEEIAATRRNGGSGATVVDGRRMRQDGPYFVYAFSTESILGVIEDAPTGVEVKGQKVAGYIVSVQGTEIVVGIEEDFGPVIPEARLITERWRILQELQDRFKQILDGQRTSNTSLAQKLFEMTVPRQVGTSAAPLALPPSTHTPNADQQEAIRKALGSEISFIWGPPGTGKTDTIGYLAAALLQCNLRILLVSHTNIATDNAIQSVAELLKSSPLYQEGKLLRFGTIAKADLPALFPMVTIDGRVETRGRSLRERRKQWSEQLRQVQHKHRLLQNMTQVSSELAVAQEQRDRAATKHAQAEAAYQKQDRERVKLASQLRHCQAQLARAQSAGAWKRFLLRLNPIRLQAKQERLQHQLVNQEQTVTQAREQQDHIANALSQITNTVNQLKHQEEALLTQLAQCGITAAHVTRMIADCTREIEQLQTELDTMKRVLEGLKTTMQREALRDARLVATTLTKVTIAKELEDQPFDVLIVDEASTAPLPSLYYAAARVAQKIIIVGDFRQLPPISKAESAMAQRWLARDIFDQAGIVRAVDHRQQVPYLTLLHFQYRMHPAISAIPNRIIYEGRLVDRVSPLPALPHEALGTRPLVLYDTSAVNPWSSRPPTGSRCNVYSALVTTTLAERAVQGTTNIGIITPYRTQVRLIKLLTADRGLSHLKISTVHQFQGLEVDIVIFDIAEGPPYRPPQFLRGEELTSTAARLINVAITRPKAQLVVIANCTYLRTRLPANSILRRLLTYMRVHGEMRHAQEIVGGDSFHDQRSFSRWRHLLDSPDNVPTLIYTQQDFYPAFFADLQRAQREIIIVSPFVTQKRTQDFLKLFKRMIADGVTVRVFLQAHEQQNDRMRQQAATVCKLLSALGVKLVERRDLHQKLAILDRMVAWEGSLNMLSHHNTTEHMRRIGDWQMPATRTCEELIAIHALDNNVQDQRLVVAEPVCSACGSPMVLVHEQRGVCMVCTNAQCGERRPVHRGDHIVPHAPCPTCGASMRVRSGPNGPFLSCSQFPACRGTRNI